MRIEEKLDEYGASFTTFFSFHSSF